VTKEKHLFRILFLASIFLLLINDLYLKFEYHNYLTGKLSDFVGLFAFPYFFSSFYPKRIKPIYILSGILFVFWKSEFSQPIFDFANSYGIGINRTIDYSDLIALLILPISYIYWNSESKQLFKPKRVLKPMIIGISCFAFIATTLPRAYGDIRMKSDFETEKQSNFEKAKKAMTFYESSQEERFIYYIEIPKRKMNITTKIVITEKPTGILNIKLDSILSYTVQGSGFIFWSGIDKDDVEYAENLTKDEIESLFKEQIDKQIK